MLKKDFVKQFCNCFGKTVEQLETIFCLNIMIVIIFLIIELISKNIKPLLKIIEKNHKMKIINDWYFLLALLILLVLLMLKHLFTVKKKHSSMDMLSNKLNIFLIFLFCINASVILIKCNILFLSKVEYRDATFVNIWLATVTLVTFCLNFMNTNVCGIPMKDIIFWNMSSQTITLYMIGFIVLFPLLFISLQIKFFLLFFLLFADLFLTFVFLLALIIVFSRETQVLILVEDKTKKMLEQYNTNQDEIEVFVKNLPISKMLVGMDYYNYRLVEVACRTLKNSFKMIIENYYTSGEEVKGLKIIMAFRIVMLKFINVQKSNSNAHEFILMILENLVYKDSEKNIPIYMMLICAIIDSDKSIDINYFLDLIEINCRREVILLTALYLGFLDTTTMGVNDKSFDWFKVKIEILHNNISAYDLDLFIKYWNVWSRENFRMEEVYYFWNDLRNICLEKHLFANSKILKKVKYEIWGER